MSVKPVAITPTLANVASSATSVTVFAANTAAKARKLVNDSTAVLYLKEGATASATSYSVALAAGAYYEFPLTASGAIYTGIVDGIWASANGNARTTESV